MAAAPPCTVHRRNLRRRPLPCHDSHRSSVKLTAASLAPFVDKTNHLCNTTGCTLQSVLYRGHPETNMPMDPPIAVQNHTGIFMPYHRLSQYANTKANVSTQVRRARQAPLACQRGGPPRRGAPTAAGPVGRLACRACV